MGQRRTSRVVVGVANTPAGIRALRCAVGQARRMGAELHAVRTWRLSVAWQGPDIRQLRTEIAAETAAELHAAFFSAVGGIPEDVDVHLQVLEGPVPQVLIGLADHDDDLIVVGTGCGRLRGGAGSVVRYCLRHAMCPVLGIPAPDLARAGRPRALARRLRRETEEYTNARAELGPPAR